MAKSFHEIRDPIHVFVRLDSDERNVVQSAPFQRLRHVHQLALSYLVYPGATHRRFEHSLGVMELAGRVYDIITQPHAVNDQIRDLVPELKEIIENVGGKRDYWRHVLRMAALCHDIGHLPFSHAAEKELLPAGWNHERLTRKIVRGNQMEGVWKNMTPPLKPEHVEKLAVGPEKASDLEFSNWEAILAEIIVGDAFGVDRMDYLLRDSYHAGVAYGKFDHYRLIDTLRILPQAPTEDDSKGRNEPMLGVEHGGLQSAEALLMARYFMYSQVYFHPVRRIYDIHLQEFLSSWLPGGKFTVNPDELVTLLDDQFIVEMHKAARDSKQPGHDPARRIVEREHFHCLYQKTTADAQLNPEAGKAIYEAAKNEFGPEAVRHAYKPAAGGSHDFPVLSRNGEVGSSLSMSDILTKIIDVGYDYVFADRDIMSKAEVWLKNNHTNIVETIAEEGEQ